MGLLKEKAGMGAKPVLTRKTRPETLVLLLELAQLSWEWEAREISKVSHISGVRAILQRQWPVQNPDRYC